MMKHSLIGVLVAYKKSDTSNMDKKSEMHPKGVPKNPKNIPVINPNPN